MRKLLGLILLGIALLIPSRASAALSVIQTVGTSTPIASCCGASASLANVFGSNITAGSSIFIGCIAESASANNNITVGVPTDTRLNSYTQASNTGSDGGGLWGNAVAISWIATGSTAGADTVTVTFTPSGFAICWIMEIGTATSAVADKTAQAAFGSSSTSYDSGATATTTAANELIVGFGGTLNVHGNFTQGTGYTLDVSSNPGDWQSGFLEHKTVSSTGTYNATATSDNAANNGAAVVIAIKEGAPAQMMPPAVYLSKNIFSRTLLFLDRYSLVR